jgi:hypothetical protein
MTPSPGQTVADLGKLVKQKYPDAYGSLSDVEVGQKVKAKYPEYSQFADMPKKFGDSLGAMRAPSGAIPGASNADTPENKQFREQLHQRNDSRGLDEIGGASMLGIARPALVAGEGAVMKALGQSLKTAARGAVGGTVAGVGGHYIARAAHLPEWAADAMGVVTGIYGAKAAADFPAFVEETNSIDPKKFVVWMLSKGKQITPMQPGKGTGTKYGGPAPEEYNPPGKNIPRRKFTPAEPTPEPKATPWAPGKGTGTKYGGPAKPDFSPPSPMPRRRGPLTAPEETPRPPADTPKQASAPRGKTQPTATPQSATSKPPFQNSAAARAGTARNITIAKTAHQNGITAAEAEKLTPAQWATAAKAVGSPAPRADAIKQIIAEIRRLESLKR